MEIIERYIYAVTKNLPEADRKDVEKELRANIEDMLQKNYDKENIRSVLEELGDPEKLSDEYRGAARYLIGPKYYVTYITILKLVISIVASVLGVIAAFSVLLQQPAPGGLIEYIIESFAAVFEAVISGAAGAAIWVTVIFVIVERTNAKIPHDDTPWTIEKLPQINTKVTKISRGEIIVSMIFYVIWIGVLLLSPNIIGIYEAGYGMTPLFNIEVLRTYLPLIILLSGVGIFVSIIKLIYGRWNGKIAALNLILNIFNTAMVIFLVQNKLLFNPAFADRVQTMFHLPQSMIDTASGTLLWSIIVISIIAAAADSISGFVKAYKAGR